MRIGLRILDIDAELIGPNPIVEPIAAAYRRFACDPGSGPDGLRIAIDDHRLQVDDVEYPLVAGLDPQLQFYQAFLNTLMRRVDAHAVLHAAALRCPDGGAMLLAAPSGHGKSSLTLELARRGFGFLSDDYAPLGLESRRITPYPRAVGVIPGGSAPIPEAFAAAAQGSGLAELFGKRLVDVGEVLGEGALAGSPVPLRRVVLLTSTEGSPPPPAVSRVDVAARDECGPGLRAELERIPGIRVDAEHRDPPVHWLRLRVDHDRRPSGSLEGLLESDRVLFFETHWSEKPDFDSTPEAFDVPRRVAAEHLGRELLNRRPGGRLLARYEGRLTPLFLELAGALRDARCVAVRVGRFRHTADLIEGIGSE